MNVLMRQRLPMRLEVNVGLEHVHLVVNGAQKLFKLVHANVVGVEVRKQLDEVALFKVKVHALYNSARLYLS